MAAEAEWVEVGTGTPESGCEVRPLAVRGVVEGLASFLERYRKLFGRSENGEHAERYVRGRLRDTGRRTTEPIARKEKVPRRALQQFVGAGPWDDQRVRGHMRQEIAGELGDPDGALIVDGSGFRKFGPHSVGAARQYCNNLGKVENCQVGEFVAYATEKGRALVDAELYLPRSWAGDRARRAAAGVPRSVRFREGWRIALARLDACREDLPHRWILGDDHYGKVILFRDGLEARGEKYLLDVPSDRRIVRANGEKTRVDRLAASLPPEAFLRVRTRDGEKGPIEVDAYREVVTPVRDERRQGPMRPEVLLVLHHADGTFSYHFSNAEHVPTASLAKAAAMRHYIEEILETAKGDAGMAEYEMRSWLGWHHHMTLSMLSTWFLVEQQRRSKRGLLPSPSPWSALPQLASSPPAS
jgi:SRSO17 transposase